MHIPIRTVVKDRTELDKEMATFKAKGGEIKLIPTVGARYTKERLIKKSLFYSVHHAFHSRNTGIPAVRLKTIQKMPNLATELEIEQLYTYFRDRGESSIWHD